MSTSTHEWVYSPVGAIVHIFLGFALTLMLLVPFWVNVYVPIVMVAPFQTTFLMMGLYCLACANKGRAFSAMHGTAAILSLAVVLIFISEYAMLNSGNQTARFNGTYCYPAIYGGCGANHDMSNTTITSIYNATSTINMSGWTATFIFACLYAGLSLVHTIISIIAFFDMSGKGQVDLEEKAPLLEGKPPPPPKQKQPDDCCAPCDGGREWSVLFTSILAGLCVFICLSKIVMGLYMLTLASLTLTPMYYSADFLYMFAAAFLLVPIPEVPPHDTTLKYPCVVIDEKSAFDEASKNPRVRSTQYFRIHFVPFPQGSSFRLLVVFYSFFFVLAIGLSVAALGSQGTWTANNRASLFDSGGLTDISRVLLEYGRSGHIEYVQYSTVSGEDAFNYDAFGQFTYIFALLDTITVCLCAVMLIPYAYYTSLIVTKCASYNKRTIKRVRKIHHKYTPKGQREAP